MIGIIITGHGEFSKGMYHSLSMIAGEHEHVSYVMFEEGMDLAAYQKELESHLNHNYDGTLFLTDLKGGTPFNISMLISDAGENIQVISGTNLPMVIEGAFLSLTASDVSQLAEQLGKVGKEGIQIVNLDDVSLETDDEEDGI